MSATNSVAAQVVQVFRVPPETVFEALIDPEMISQWMFGPNLRDEEILHIQNDPQVGGKFSFLVRRQGAEIDHVGEYLEVNPPRRLSFTWGIRQEASQSRVTIDLIETSGGCELILVHDLDPKWAEFVDRSVEAWSKMLSALASLIK